MSNLTCPAADLDLSCIKQSERAITKDLESIFLHQQIAIEHWFRQQWQKTPAPITSSVDLRNEGFRLAPVDTNLFPAGFNNLNPTFLPLCIQAAQSSIVERMPGCTKILIIPENHTRNTFYFDSLVTMVNIFSKAGFEVRIGSLLESLEAPQAIPNSTRFLEPIIRENNRLKLADFDPCMILLNNDLSSGIPELFNHIAQPFYPNPQLGWSTRLKSQHFTHYQQVAQTFAEHIHIDPWRITPFFSACTDVDFMTGVGMEKLTHTVEVILAKTAEKYREYHIQQDPFVVIKADSGTYGMGIMMVKHPEEILQLNRKQRTKMSASKGQQKINHVIVQEGVYTFETAGAAHSVAEPVIYMMGQYVIGGFYRVHNDKRKDENLNTPGMHFEPLAFEGACNNPQFSPCCNRFYMYSVIARLASLAAAREAEQVSI